MKILNYQKLVQVYSLAHYFFNLRYSVGVMIYFDLVIFIKYCIGVELEWYLLTCHTIQSIK